MTRSICADVEALIDCEAQGWSDAERLRVEQHLGHCARCEKTLSVARMVRGTIEAAPYELSSIARSRAAARAFASTDGAAVRAPGARRPRLTWTLPTMAAAAAAAALFLVREPRQLVPQQERPLTVRSSVAGHTQQAVSPSELEPTTWIETREPVRHTFAHAAVELGAATRVRFDPEHTTLDLQQGRLDVDVDVTQGRAFSVTTAHFRVQVLGTRFMVTPESVRVERGRVQVFALDGAVLARDLGAGASFSYGTGATTLERAPALPARVWLARAREALSHRHTKLARELVARAEESDPLRADRAEASTLRAEAALLDADPSAAIRLYLSVSARYADLVAGENAAFAAAQLSARAEPTRERALLRRYLRRYPKGRFTDEAERRVSKLTAP